MSSFNIPYTPFYFIRHGETEWNREQKIMGHQDIPLNAAGIVQAHQAIHSLQDLGIERLVSSPLLRAKQTAEIFKSSLKVPIEINKDLTEIGWGKWEGIKVNEGYNFEKWVNGYTPQNAESCTAFQQRIVKAFSTILNTNKKTLIVAHNGVYWALMNALGYPDCKAQNCVPYFFYPENHLTYSCFVFSESDEEEMSKKKIIGGRIWTQITP